MIANTTTSAREEEIPVRPARRFSEGMERSPLTPSTLRVGRFSDGTAPSLALSADVLGSFADGLVDRPTRPSPSASAASATATTPSHTGVARGCADLPWPHRPKRRVLAANAASVATKAVPGPAGRRASVVRDARRLGPRRPTSGSVTLSGTRRTASAPRPARGCFRLGEASPPTGARRHCSYPWRLLHKPPTDPVRRSVMGRPMLEWPRFTQPNGTRLSPGRRIALRLHPSGSKAFRTPLCNSLHAKQQCAAARCAMRLSSRYARRSCVTYGWRKLRPRHPRTRCTSPRGPRRGQLPPGCGRLPRRLARRRTAGLCLSGRLLRGRGRRERPPRHRRP